MTNTSNPLLLQYHREQLTKDSGIASEVILEREYRSVVLTEGYAALKPYGFSRAQANLPGLLLPLWTTDGQNGLMIYRPDTPRVDSAGKPHKYELPRNAGVRLDCPPRSQPMLADPSISLWITEGQKKADALVSHGLCAIDLLGVWNFKGKNPFGGTTVLADFDYIALNNRLVRIVFDNDLLVKAPVKQALERLIEHLQRKGAHASAVYLPQDGGRKVGVDDFLLTHTVEALEGLIEQPRTQIPPTAPTIEILSKAPQSLTRPLALIDGQAYAASWLWVKKTTTEIPDKNGGVLKLSAPHIVEGRTLFMQRDDGVCFSAVADGWIRPMGELEVSVHLPEIPLDSRLWSAEGFLAYRGGARVEAGSVFRRVAEVVNTFIDFNRSLADQQIMSEMVACYIISTWFLDAFYVVGFLWPNGDRGSGKTQLLNVVTELSYLGQTILAGGSYACLRDMADYGATLAFDDAENLSDPKRTDPDKRALLLAGNRRGNTVAVKEQGPNGTWHTRHVNTFCPRLFSAIRLPDAVLASRAIVVPLIRTPDRERANVDPLDYDKWPHDRSKLIDDLWALALCHLPELPRHVSQVDQQATLTGRNLEPWRPLLAVAHWLDEAGVHGVWGRMEALSQAYQTERPDLESTDLAVLLIKALCRGVLARGDTSDTSATSDTNKETPQESVFTTSEIKAWVVSVALEEESSLDTEKLSTDRVGRALGRMRLKKRREGGKGTRQWVVPLTDLHGWVTSYGLVVSEDWPPPLISVTSGGRVTSVTGEQATPHVSDDPPWDEVVLANGTYAQLRIPSEPPPLPNTPTPLEITAPEPDSPQPSDEMLQSPSIEVGVSFECPQYTYITQASELENVLPDLLSVQTLGIDLETTGLDPHTDQLCVVQVATPEHVYVINALQCPIAMLAPMLEGDRWFFGQNLKFDLQFLVQSGLPWPTAKLFDTMLGAQVLDASKDYMEKGAHTLGTLVERFLDRPLDKTLQVSDWSQELSTEQIRYAAIDVAVLHPLVKSLSVELANAQLWNVAKLESACVPALAWIELNGMPVDAEQWRARAIQQQQRKTELAHELSALVGRDVNWGSPKQVLEVLRARGVLVESTGKEALISHVADEVVAKILDYRQAATYAQTYGESWLAHVHPLTGRVHADYRQIGAGAGRMSCTEPNLQNIPRDHAYRSLFHVADDRRLIKADYSQIELRIAAIMAPDEKLVQAYCDGVDLHILTAAGVIGIRQEDVTADQRQLAKALNFGLLYGMGALRLQGHAWAEYGVRLTEAEAQQHKSRWLDLYPGFRRWHDRTGRRLNRQGSIDTRTLCGRRRLEIGRYTEVLNSPIQGSGADGLKLALADLFAHKDEAPGARIVNVVHDEIVVECPLDAVESTMRWLKRYMEAAMQGIVKGKIPTPVDMHVGQSWAG